VLSKIYYEKVATFEKAASKYSSFVWAFILQKQVQKPNQMDPKSP
jgi:hypothetical protein